MKSENHPSNKDENVMGFKGKTYLEQQLKLKIKGRGNQQGKRRNKVKKNETKIMNLILRAKALILRWYELTRKVKEPFASC